MKSDKKNKQLQLVEHKFEEPQSVFHKMTLPELLAALELIIEAELLTEDIYSDFGEKKPKYLH